MIALLLAAALQAPAAPAPTPTPKLRCKRQDETGSFVRKRRICRTEAEWRELERQDNRELDRLRDRTQQNSHRPTT